MHLTPLAATLASALLAMEITESPAHNGWLDQHGRKLLPIITAATSDYVRVAEGIGDFNNIATTDFLLENISLINLADIPQYPVYVDSAHTEEDVSEVDFSILGENAVRPTTIDLQPERVVFDGHEFDTLSQEMNLDVMADRLEETFSIAYNPDNSYESDATPNPIVTNTILSMSATIWIDPELYDIEDIFEQNGLTVFIEDKTTGKVVMPVYPHGCGNGNIHLNPFAEPITREDSNLVGYSLQISLPTHHFNPQYGGFTSALNDFAIHLAIDNMDGFSMDNFEPRIYSLFMETVDVASTRGLEQLMSNLPTHFNIPSQDFSDDNAVSIIQNLYI